MELTELGWDSFFEGHFEPYRKENYFPLRITRENRGMYTAWCERGEMACELSGRFRHETPDRSGFPAVGDWVAGSVLPGENKAVIHALLPRRSAFSRKVAGETTEEQVAAANIDTVFIVMGLDLNYNLRRIERYLAAAWNSGAVPVIVLNKADLCADAEVRRLEVEMIAPGAEVCAVSAADGAGFEPLEKHIRPGRTVAFLGSSGVGKSTIINAFLGEDRLRTNDVSGTGSRGRHTTTFRELIVLPGGGIVIDTPGMRELQVWGGGDGLAQAFEDIEEISQGCRFKDCGHENEPGCAVLLAVEVGSLSPERLESFRKLKREFAYLAERQSMKPSAVEKSRNKAISKEIKRYFKNRED